MLFSCWEETVHDHYEKIKRIMFNHHNQIILTLKGFLRKYRMTQKLDQLRMLRQVLIQAIIQIKMKNYH